MSAASAMGAEFEACNVLRKSLGDKVKKKKIALCVDSKILEDMYYKAKAGLGDSREGFDIIENIVSSYPNIYLVYINRRWNQSTDYLAKQGKMRNSFT